MPRYKNYSCIEIFKIYMYVGVCFYIRQIDEHYDDRLH